MEYLTGIIVYILKYFPFLLSLLMKQEGKEDTTQSNILGALWSRKLYTNGEVGDSAEEGLENYKRAAHFIQKS